MYLKLLTAKRTKIFAELAVNIGKIKLPCIAELLVQIRKLNILWTFFAKFHVDFLNDIQFSRKKHVIFEKFIIFEIIFFKPKIVFGRTIEDHCT